MGEVRKSPATWQRICEHGKELGLTFLVWELNCLGAAWLTVDVGRW